MNLLIWVGSLVLGYFLLRLLKGPKVGIRTAAKWGVESVLRTLGVVSLGLIPLALLLIFLSLTGEGDMASDPRVDLPVAGGMVVVSLLLFALFYLLARIAHRDLPDDRSRRAG